MNSIFKTNEENKLIPHIEKKCQKLKNRQVQFEGFINTVRYDVYKEVTLYDFKINNEKIPFLLSSQLFLLPCFDIYHADKHKDLEIVFMRMNCICRNSTYPARESYAIRRAKS